MYIINRISEWHTSHITPFMDACDTTCINATIRSVQYIQTHVLKLQNSIQEDTLAEYAKRVPAIIDTLAITLLLSSTALSIISTASIAFLCAKHLAFLSLSTSEKTQYIHTTILPIFSTYAKLTAVLYGLLGISTISLIHIVRSLSVYSAAYCFDHLRANASSM